MESVCNMRVMFLCVRVCVCPPAPPPRPGFSLAALAPRPSRARVSLASLGARPSTLCTRADAAKLTSTL